MNEYWVRCKYCKMAFKTSARIGQRIKCRRNNCGRIFKVLLKFKTREELEMLGGV